MLEDQPQFMAEVFVHAADIGNPLMSSCIAERWGHLINQELIAQHKDEIRFELPISAMMVGLADSKKAAKAQLGFIEFIVQPYVEPLFSLYPRVVTPKKNLQSNIERINSEMTFKQL